MGVNILAFLAGCFSGQDHEEGLQEDVGTTSPRSGDGETIQVGDSVQLAVPSTRPQGGPHEGVGVTVDSISTDDPMCVHVTGAGGNNSRWVSSLLLFKTHIVSIYEKRLSDMDELLRLIGTDQDTADDKYQALRFEYSESPDALTLFEQIMNGTCKRE